MLRLLQRYVDQVGRYVYLPQSIAARAAPYRHLPVHFWQRQPLKESHSEQANHQTNLVQSSMCTKRSLSLIGTKAAFACLCLGLLMNILLPSSKGRNMHGVSFLTRISSSVPFGNASPMPYFQHCLWMPNLEADHLMLSESA